jgi:hypothetical protein
VRALGDEVHDEAGDRDSGRADEHAGDQCSDVARMDDECRSADRGEVDEKPLKLENAEADAPRPRERRRDPDEERGEDAEEHERPPRGRDLAPRHQSGTRDERQPDRRPSPWPGEEASVGDPERGDGDGRDPRSRDGRNGRPLEPAEHHRHTADSVTSPIACRSRAHRHPPVAGPFARTDRASSR